MNIKKRYLLVLTFFSEYELENNGLYDTFTVFTNKKELQRYLSNSKKVSFNWFHLISYHVFEI